MIQISRETEVLNWVVTVGLLESLRFEEGDEMLPHVGIWGKNIAGIGIGTAKGPMGKACLMCLKNSKGHTVAEGRRSEKVEEQII